MRSNDLGGDGGFGNAFFSLLLKCNILLKLIFKGYMKRWNDVGRFRVSIGYLLFDCFCYIY